MRDIGTAVVAVLVLVVALVLAYALLSQSQ
jgi:hypothetical protein